MTRIRTRSTSSTTTTSMRLDEIDDGEQLVSIWCHIHGDYEWHWMPFEDLPFR
jgi:hypothetical protein